MGFWNKLFSFLGLADEEPLETSQSSHTTTETQTRGPSPGDVFSGYVEYVGDTFAKVTSEDLTAVVFLNEMTDRMIKNPSDILHEGENINFVLLKPDPKGWVASIREAKIRESLSRVRKGDRIRGKIVELNDYGAVIDEGSYKVRVPKDEISLNFIDHPSEGVLLGEEVEAEITRVYIPTEWHTDGKYARAKVYGSIRNFLLEAKSPKIEIAFSCLPFKVCAIAKTPRNCDPVVLYVLQELDVGRSRDQIAATTGLPNSTIEKLHEVLVAEGLVRHWRPREDGNRLVEAISLANELNRDPIHGLFASAAHPDSQFLTVEEHQKQKEYPRWPRPVYHKGAEDLFAMASDENLPERLIERIVKDDKLSILNKLQNDNRLRVFLRRDGSRPWKPAYLDIPEHWFFAGLWSVFEPFVGNPHKPSIGNLKCRNFLMVRCHAFESEKGDSLKTVFFEPYTSSVWWLKESDQVKIKEHHGAIFPSLPSLGSQGVQLESGAVAMHIVAETWCTVTVLSKGAV